MPGQPTQPNSGTFSAEFGDHYTSVLWVSSYAPKKELLKKCLWKNFEPTYYRIAQISYGRFAPSGLSFADAPVKRSSQRELGYFGTRYYDGDVGLWISVDPARQFWSPYGYGPGNPVNGLDPDGAVWRTVVNSRLS